MTSLPQDPGIRAADATIWSYDQAFSRNLGLVNPEEQAKLRASCVAIAGMGGVGGVHLMTLARLGVGAFRIADPDTFELANFNRQYGAEMATLGRSKVEVMAEKARGINPDLKIEIFREKITAENIDRFLQGVADVLGRDRFLLVRCAEAGVSRSGAAGDLGGDGGTDWV